MKRILFLDDYPTRRRWAERELPFDADSKRIACVLTVDTANAAIGELSRSMLWNAYHEVYLDHDLGGEEHVDSSRRDTGMEVVRWIVANRPEIGIVIVHTLNNPAGCNMVAALRDAGYRAEYVPFLALAKARMECSE